MPEVCGFKCSHFIQSPICSSILNNTFLRGCDGEAAPTEPRGCTSVPACVSSCFWISWVRSEKLQWHNNLSPPVSVRVPTRGDHGKGGRFKIKRESIKSTNLTSCSSVKVRSTLRESRAVQRGKGCVTYLLTDKWHLCYLFFFQIRWLSFMISCVSNPYKTSALSETQMVVNWGLGVLKRSWTIWKVGEYWQTGYIVSAAVEVAVSTDKAG